MVMRMIRPHIGKWNVSKYKILTTLIALDKPAACGEIAYWSGIPVKSVWKDMWRYHQINYVRQVGNSRHYHYRITAKGCRFLEKMKILHLVDTNRIDNELKKHWLKLKHKERE